MPESFPIQHTIERYLDGTATPEERLQLEQWYASLAIDKRVHARIPGIEEMKAQSWQALLEQISEVNTTPVIPVHRVHFLKTAWFRYAAAIILIFGIGSYLYISIQKEKPSVNKIVQNDVAPGGNKAMLILADGTKIMLDSAANGKLAEQGSARIEKTGEGKIVYTGGNAAADVMYNTMSTPRGGQYQLTLPDGSRVWLNAESSITYPAVFVGDERKVSITGEAFFEVAKNKSKKFIVSVSSPDEKLAIEVLGTQFNVNAYPDESSTNTTLIEGSVNLRSVHTSLMLKPGQQGQWNDQKLSLAVKPDVEQVVAWKNGMFNFNRLPLKEVLKQLARWYDVEVVYEGEIPAITFGGEMERNLNLSQVLRVLSTLGVQFRIEGKKLIVGK